MKEKYKEYFRILLKYFGGEYIKCIDLAIKDGCDKFAYDERYILKTIQTYNYNDWCSFNVGKCSSLEEQVEVIYFSCSVVDGLLVVEEFEGSCNIFLSYHGMILSGVKSGEYFFGGKILK